MKILIISPWGDPRNWNMADYHPVNDRGETDLATKIQDRNSTLAEASYLSSLGHDVKVLSVSSSTLYPYTGADTTDYSTLKSKVKDFIKGLVSGDYELEIAPGIGTFKNGSITYYFRGTPGAYQAAFFVHVLKRLIDYGPDMIALDTTHGINYMVTASMRSVEAALSVYSLERALKGVDDPVSFIQINSDPVTRETTEANLNRVFSDRVYEPQVTKYMRQEMRVTSPLSPEGKAKPAVGKSDILGLGMALDNGLALAALYISYEAEIDQMVEPARLLEEFEENVKISREGDKVTVEYPFLIHDSYLNYSVGFETLKRIKESAGSPPFPKEVIVSLERLMSPPARVILEKEIENVEELIDIMRLETGAVLGVDKDEQKGRELPMDYLWSLGNMRVIEWARGKKPERKKVNCGFEERNFMAHGSLVKEVTVIYLDEGNRIRLAYEEECLKQILGTVKRLGKGE